MKNLLSILSPKLPFVQRWMPAVAVAAVILAAFTKGMPISILWLVVFIAYGRFLYFFQQTDGKRRRKPESTGRALLFCRLHRHHRRIKRAFFASWAGASNSAKIWKNC